MAITGAGDDRMGNPAVIPEVGLSTARKAERIEIGDIRGNDRY